MPVSCHPDSLDASLSTRTFSSTDQLFEVGLFIAHIGQVRASRNHRESVSCEMPVSRASRRELSALLPVRRSIIFCLYGSEYGLVTSPHRCCQECIRLLREIPGDDAGPSGVCK